MDPVQSLEDQYFLLRGSLQAFKDAGATPTQIALLQTLISKSQDNYFAAVRKALEEDNAEVDALTTQLDAEQKNVQTTVNHLNNVANALKVITKAVDVGFALAGKIASL